MNDRLYLLIHGWSGRPALDAIAAIAAEWLIFGIAVIAAALVVRSARQAPEILPWVALALGAGYLLKLLATALRPQRRPFEVHEVDLVFAHSPGQSFPSNHATAAFACALVCLAFVSRRWGRALVAAATVVGLARVYGGVHYPADIAGGLIVAAAGVFASLIVATLSGRYRTSGPRSDDGSAAVRAR